jgi:predicted dehydrogenase
MFDWGTHWLDMFFFFNSETPAEWVLGQIDARSERSAFGVPLESQAICQVKFSNGVRGLLFTGHDSDIGCQIRITGSEGVIELQNTRPSVRVRGRPDSGWRCPEVEEELHGGAAIDRAIGDVVSCLESGSEPELGSARALRATEVIFATYESSRRRGRVDIPLETEDSAFLTMLEAGEIGPDAPS